jgi:hypothetical protein
MKNQFRNKIKTVLPVIGETKIRWRNDGGPFRAYDGSIKTPGKVFKEYPSRIPKGFRDVIICLDGSPEEAISPLPEKTTKSGYELVVKSVGWYDVINIASGKIENEKGLRKADAEALIKSLSGK